MAYFVIDTSFQMLCAIEARDVLSTAETNRLLIEMHEGSSLKLEQILSLDDGNWSSIDILHFPRGRGPKRSICRIYNLLKIRMKYGREKVCFIATLSDGWFRRTPCILGARKIFRLDDGNASIRIISNIREKRSSFPGYAPNYHLFTMFYVDSDGLDKNKIIPNKFTFFRNKLSVAKLDSDVAWILGGAYFESGLIEFEREISMYNKIKNYCTNRICIYLPHRSDSADKIERMKSLGYLISDIGPSFEQRILSTSPLPSKIIGVCSTALFTANEFIPHVEIISFEMLPAPNLEYDNVYRSLRELGHVDKWRSHSLMQATSTKPRKLTAVLS